MRLLPLSFEGKASVTCKDIVNTLVVFSEVGACCFLLLLSKQGVARLRWLAILWDCATHLTQQHHRPPCGNKQATWVGTAEANPEETPLPFPPELRFTQVG